MSERKADTVLTPNQPTSQTSISSQQPGSGRQRPSTWRPLVRSAAVGFIGGVLIWGAADVLGEFTTFLKLRDRAFVLANQNQELKDQIGHPFSLGPWYNSRIGFTAGGSIAQCTFQLQGTRQITDVTVRGLREAGLVSRALYNLIGPGTWTVVDCTAMFPGGGGTVQPKSLLPSTSQEKQEKLGTAAPAQAGS